MSDFGVPLPLDPQLDRLLAETFLRVRQGRYAEATARLAEAKELAPDHPAVLELEGDLAFAQRRYRQAESLYKQAFTLNPQNTKLEEKYATAVLKVHTPEILSHQIPDDSLWSNRVPRTPIVSLLQSSVLPGLGQFSNGDWLKGLLVLGVWLLLNGCQFSMLYTAMSRVALSIENAPQLLQAFTKPGPFLTGLLLCALWCYAVIDAWWVAKNSR
ncbi:MAG TPA: hypothetical protein VGL77_11685 [Armatimonadota bacterium]|jgi:tetratricopeptide (TPR) repeat protein